jgi:hypothetical protein
MTTAGGCSSCGDEVLSKRVSPHEEVSARYCEQCQHIVGKLTELVEAIELSGQGALQINALARLRRVEQVAHDLVRRRMFAAVQKNVSWADISDAVGLPEDEAKRAYPMRNYSDSDYGWDDRR